MSCWEDWWEHPICNSAAKWAALRHADIHGVSARIWFLIYTHVQGVIHEQSDQHICGTHVEQGGWHVHRWCRCFFHCDFKRFHFTGILKKKLINSKIIKKSEYSWAQLVQQASTIQYKCHLGEETLCDRLILLWGNDDDLCVHKESGNARPAVPWWAFHGISGSQSDGRWPTWPYFPLITAQ